MLLWYVVLDWCNKTKDKKYMKLEYVYKIYDIKLVLFDQLDIKGCLQNKSIECQL